MPKVSIRYQRASDAKRFFEILMNPNFIYFFTKVKSVAEERDVLKTTPGLRKSNIEWRYTILYGDEIVGGIGMKINRFRKYIGEISYFLDENYWGRGITARAVKLIEKEGFKSMGLSRIEILMHPVHRASEKVAIKAGYKKEGLLRKAFRDKRDGQMKDCLLYAKTL